MAVSPSQYHHGQIVTAGSNEMVKVSINWLEKSKTLLQWVPGSMGGVEFVDSQGSLLSPHVDPRKKLLQWINGVRIYSLDPKQIAREMPLMPQAELQRRWRKPCDRARPP